MKPQKIFDTVAAHLFKQGKKSMNEDNDGCLYRGRDGLTCAIGCLIRDEEYTQDMEGKDLDRLLDYWELPRLLPHRDLLRALQTLHDETDVDEWVGGLANIAYRNELIFTRPELNPRKA